MAASWLAIGGAMGCALTAVGCFSPSIPEGYACGAGESCPPGQGCDLDGICRAEADVTDDQPDSGVAIGHDEDGDGIDDALDNCPGLANADQDDDGDGGDGVGDACDPNPGDPGDVILAFASFAEPDALGDWKVVAGSSTFLVDDDSLQQIDGSQGVSAIALQGLTGTVGSVDVGAQLTSSMTPFDGAFGAAIGLGQEGNAVSAYGCLRSAWSLEPGLQLVELDRDELQVLQSSPANGAAAEEMAHYRVTALSRDGGAGFVDLECEMLGVDGVDDLWESRESERDGRFGVVTVDAAARFGYLVVYGRDGSWSGDRFRFGRRYAHLRHVGHWRPPS